MNVKKLTEEEIKERVFDVLSDYLSHPAALEMKKYIQHGDISTYDHALSVAILCYKISYRKKRVDTELLTRAAFLHDLYLYDWHDPDPSHKWHGFHHARRAADNAVGIFGVSDKARQIILTHMWPLNLTAIPNSREAWILTLVDKRVSASETIRGFLKRKKKEQA